MKNLLSLSCFMAILVHITSSVPVIGTNSTSAASGPTNGVVDPTYGSSGQSYGVNSTFAASGPTNGVVNSTFAASGPTNGVVNSTFAASGPTNGVVNSTLETLNSTTGNINSTSLDQKKLSRNISEANTTRRTYSTRYYGQNNDDPFYFMCPVGKIMTSISGTSDKNGIVSLSFTCSDGMLSGEYGIAGKAIPFSLPIITAGIHEIVISADTNVKSIGYANQVIGAIGGSLTAVGEANGCPMVGVQGYAYAKVSSLSFIYGCGKQEGGVAIREASLAGSPSLASFPFLFECPSKSAASSLNSLQNSKGDIIGLQVQCSDSSATLSQTFGSLKGTSTVNLTGVTQNSLINSLVVNVADDRVMFLATAGASVGFPQSDTQILQHPNACAISGVFGLANQYNVNSLGLLYTCDASLITTPLPTIVPQVLLGGRGGYQSIAMCAGGHKMTQLIVTSDDTYIFSFQFRCDDGGVSAVFGNAKKGSPSQFPVVASGIKSFIINSDHEVRTIGYNATFASPYASSLANLVADENGCPAIGAIVRSDKLINALSFVFSC